MAATDVSVKVSKERHEALKKESRLSGRRIQWMIDKAIEEFLKQGKNGGKP